MLVQDIWLQRLNKNRDHGRELTQEELRRFAEQVYDAKRDEVASWIEHGAFEAQSEAFLGPGPRVQTSRWVMTWKWDTLKSCWMVKGRLCVRDFQDAQQEFVLSKNPTAQRTAQRMLVSTAAVFRWKPISVDT